jgi:hypothetical protein
VLPSSCRIAIEDWKNSSACPPLLICCLDTYHLIILYDSWVFRSAHSTIHPMSLLLNKLVNCH